MAKPIIKWVGGKRQLLPSILERIPKTFNQYFEPFIGGGALFFELNKKGSTISDYNKDLINLYKIVKNNPIELIEDLQKHINSSEYYYKIRELDRTEDFSSLSPIEKASRLIFLNKTCFNGLYRVNKKGQFNVPYGKYKNPQWIDEENILKASELFKKTKILNGDFEIIKPLIKKGDFIYLDPPYVPLNNTSNFTSYTDNGFSLEDQLRLKKFCDYIDSIGAYFLLSNSYTDFIIQNYKKYKIEAIMAKRSINAKGDKRGKVKEVLIRNY